MREVDEKKLMAFHPGLPPVSGIIRNNNDETVRLVPAYPASSTLADGSSL